MPIKTWLPTVASSWNTAANWSPSGVPASGDDVRITSNIASAAAGVINVNTTISPATMSFADSTSTFYPFTLSGSSPMSVPAAGTIVRVGNTNVPAYININISGPGAIIFGSSGSSTSTSDLYLSGTNTFSGGLINDSAGRTIFFKDGNSLGTGRLTHGTNTANRIYPAITTASVTIANEIDFGTTLGWAPTRSGNILTTFSGALTSSVADFNIRASADNALATFEFSGDNGRFAPTILGLGGNTITSYAASYTFNNQRSFPPASTTVRWNPFSTASRITFSGSFNIGNLLDMYGNTALKSIYITPGDTIVSSGTLRISGSSITQCLTMQGPGRWIQSGSILGFTLAGVQIRSGAFFGMLASSNTFTGQIGNSGTLLLGPDTTDLTLGVIPGIPTQTLQLSASTLVSSASITLSSNRLVNVNGNITLDIESGKSFIIPSTMSYAGSTRLNVIGGGTFTTPRVPYLDASSITGWNSRIAFADADFGSLPASLDPANIIFPSNQTDIFLGGTTHTISGTRGIYLSGTGIFSSSLSSAGPHFFYIDSPVTGTGQLIFSDRWVTGSSAGVVVNVYFTGSNSSAKNSGGIGIFTPGQGWLHSLGEKNIGSSSIEFINKGTNASGNAGYVSFFSDAGEGKTAYYANPGPETTWSFAAIDSGGDGWNQYGIPVTPSTPRHRANVMLSSDGGTTWTTGSGGISLLSKRGPEYTNFSVPAGSLVAVMFSELTTFSNEIRFKVYSGPNGEGSLLYDFVTGSPTLFQRYNIPAGFTYTTQPQTSHRLLGNVSWTGTAATGIKSISTMTGTFTDPQVHEYVGNLATNASNTSAVYLGYNNEVTTDKARLDVKLSGNNSGLYGVIYPGFNSSNIAVHFIGSQSLPNPSSSIVAFYSAVTGSAARQWIFSGSMTIPNKLETSTIASQAGAGARLNVAAGDIVTATGQHDVTGSLSFYGSGSFAAWNATSFVGPGEWIQQGVIAGQGALVLEPGSRLTLANSANTFSGLMSASNGVITIPSGVGEGCFGGIPVTASPGIHLTQNARVAISASLSLSEKRQIAITGSGIFDIASGATVTQPGLIIGGSFMKDGAGTLVLSGSNTFSGGTIIASGTLDIANTIAIASGSVAVRQGGTLIASNTSTLNPLIVNSSLILSGGTIQIG